MNAKVMVLLLLSIFTFLLAGKKADNKISDTAWKQVKQRNEILVSSRWYDTQNIQKQEIKAEACIHLSKDKLLEIIQSGIYTSEWMSMVENCYVEQGINKNLWASQYTLGLIWPLSKNNLEVSYHLLNHSEDSSYITFSSKKAMVVKKMVKPVIYQFNGSWELISVGENKTKIILKTKLNKRNVMYHWIVSPMISEGSFYTLKKLKQFSEEKFYLERNFLATTDL